MASFACLYLIVHETAHRVEEIRVGTPLFADTRVQNLPTYAASCHWINFQKTDF